MMIMQLTSQVFLSLLRLQAQRDFFGSHTYERVDKEGSYHTLWPGNSADSITTSGYTS